MRNSDKKGQEIIKNLLQWIGDNPTRDDLKETPKRVVARYKKIFSGYNADLNSILKKPTIPINKVSGIVIIPKIKFISFCEHHLLPMIGEINVAYMPKKKLAGIGTIIKIVKVFTNRLQLQEKLTEQIAETIKKYLEPNGVAIDVKARHYCVDSEITDSLSEELITYSFLDCFKTDKELQNQFLIAVNKNTDALAQFLKK